MNEKMNMVKLVGSVKSCISSVRSRTTTIKLRLKTIRKEDRHHSSSREE